jgi:TolA-binding protein
MTSEPQKTGELSRLLQRLGEEPVPQRDHEQEGQRAEAVAQYLNRELASLVRQRRAALLRPLLAAAAALILGIGAWQLWPRSGRLAIEQEPLVPGAAVRTEPAVSDPPEPAPRQQPAPRSLPDGRPQRAPSSSAQPGAATAAVPSGSEQAHSSTLADENRLFKDAAEATRAGDTDGALRQFDRLLEQYPASPLAQTALVRKLRLLDKAGRSDAAVAAANRYLELYPNGFAASEAQALVRGQVNPPTSPEPQP